MGKKILTPWWKGFLTSILGTTISIALTFGTTTLVNSKKKQDAQRLTAMMVIDDIEKSIETLKKIRNHEEQGYNAAMYAMERLDSIESLSVDTLNIIYNYLLEGASISSDLEFSDSSEKLFHSSQDSWSNLNSARFIHNIEEFYKDRRLLPELKNDARWRKPVSKAETDSVELDSDILDSWEGFCAYLKDVMGRRRCKKYVQFYIDRLRLYNQIIEGWTNLNEENMFLMDITDEEMKEFVEKTTKQDRPASEKDIVGTWISSAVDAHKTKHEIRKDHTFKRTESYSLHDRNIAGKAYMEITFNGKWYMEADSLIMIIDIASVETNLNDSSLVYREGQRDSLKRELHAYVEAQQLLFMKKLEEIGERQARAASIDVTGNKLELTGPDNEAKHYRRPR